MNKIPLTHKEVSSRGGRTTLERRGRDYFQELSRKAVESLKNKVDPDYYKRLSKMGVEARKRKREAAKLNT